MIFPSKVLVNIYPKKFSSVGLCWVARVVKVAWGVRGVELVPVSAYTLF